MDKFFIYVFSNLIIICFMAHCVVITLDNQYVKRYGNVKINCSSKTVPIGKTANIEVSGKSFTAITILDTGKCFSSVLRNVCPQDLCTCSRKGLWFSHKYNVKQDADMINITCSMILETGGSSSDSIKVKVIDFTGPTIKTEPVLPFPAVINATFICMVDTLSSNIIFQWECLGNSTRTTMSGKAALVNSRKHYLVITRDIYLKDDGKTCKCSVQVEGIPAVSEISVIISKKPIIEISKPARCEMFSSAMIYCTILDAFSSFEFNWIHSRHETLIRKVHGQNNYTMSILTIKSCSHEDSGNYTCVAYNRYGGELTFANKTVSLLVYGSPIIHSAETISCNTSVTLSCIIRTGPLTYGFYPWIHSLNGKFIRNLTGSMYDKESILEFEVCSYQDVGDYTCTAWNTYGNTTLVANKNISLVVYAPPVVISSEVLKGQTTTLSVSFYSSTEVVPKWQLFNQTISNSTDQMQIVDSKQVELIVYNKSIECGGYIANLSVKSALVGEYILILKNAFGEAKLFFDTFEPITPASTAFFDLRVLILGIVALGIFMLTAAGAVIMSKRIQHTHVIHIIGPNERCPTLQIYHSAPTLDTLPNVYDAPDHGYLEVIDDSYELDIVQDSESKSEEHDESSYISSSHYDDVDY